MRNLFTSVCCLLSFLCFAQEQTQRLLVTERTKDHIYLTVYNFENGTYLFKDTVLITASRSSASMPYVYYDWKMPIIKNQYLITSNSIIDINTKSIVWHHNETNVFPRLAEIKGDKVIFSKSSASNPTTYHSFDLKDLTLSDINKNSFTETNEFNNDEKYSISPNGRYRLSMAARQALTLFDLYLYDTQNFTRTKDFGARGKKLGTNVAKELQAPIVGSPTVCRVAFDWADNENVLYDNHIYDCTISQKPKLEIKKYNIETKVTETIFTLDSIDTYSHFARFEKDAKDQLFYLATVRMRYQLDLIDKKHIINPHFYLNDHISFVDGDEGKTLFYEDTVIGSAYVSQMGISVSNGSIAIEHIDTDTVHKSKKGIKVWVKETNEWMTFDIPWVDTIIGWTEEN